MRKLLALSMMLIALTQAGFTCGPGIDPPSLICQDGSAPAQPTVQIGQVGSDRSFQPLSADQVYPREFGSQGGQHVFVSVRFYAHEGESEWNHEFHLRDDMGVEFGQRSITEATCAPGWTVVENMRVFVDYSETNQGTIEVRSGPIDANGAPISVLTSSGAIHLQ